MKDEKVFSILLIIMAGIMLVLNVALAVVGVMGVKSTGEAASSAAWNNVGTLTGAAELSKTFGDVRANLYKLALAEEESEEYEYLCENLAELNKIMEHYFETYAAYIVQMEQMHSFEGARQRYAFAVRPVLLSISFGDGERLSGEEILSAIREIEPDLAAVNNSLYAYMSISEMIAEMSADEAHHSSITFGMTIISVAVLSVMASITLLIGAIVHYFTSKAGMKAEA